VDTVSRTTNAVQEAYKALLKVGQRMGLSINQDMTKYMEAIGRPPTQSHIIIERHHTEVVKEFKHLGTIITFNNKEIDRIIMANKCYYGLK
jgi:hypothetical protein